MRVHVSACVAVATLWALALTPAFSQTKKPVKPKPKAAQTKLGTIGTAQLPGDQCEVGKTYTIGKDNALNFTITSLEYKATRMVLSKKYVICPAGSKFLVVNFTIQNPLPKTQSVEVPLDITAVTPTDQNVSASNTYLKSNGENLFQEIKPGQKIECFSYIEVPAAKQVPKLMVANHVDSTARIARYDVRGKVTKLPTPYADPSDPTGATAFDEVPVKLGDVCDLGGVDVTITKPEFVKEQIKGITEDPLEEGKIYLLFTAKVTNFNVDGQLISAPFFEGELKDADGAVTSEGGHCLRPSTLARFDATIAYNGSLTQRIDFLIPAGIEQKTLKIKNGNGRAFVIDLGSLKG